MSDLDQRIDQAIIDALPQWFFDSDETGVVLTATLESATPAIIGAVRAELLSDESMQAVTNAIGRMFRTDGPEPNGYERYKTHDYALAAVTAAIAAAFGEEASDERD